MKWKISQGEEKKKNPNSRKNRKTKILLLKKKNQLSKIFMGGKNIRPKHYHK